MNIPFENGNAGDRAPVLSLYLKEREAQMRYTRKAKESGIYGQWITQLTEDEIKAFKKECRERIEKGLEYKTFGPILKKELIYRDALYELELCRRYYPNDFDEKIKEWEDDLKGDLIAWEVRYDVAMQQWQAEKGLAVKSSQTTPYY